MILKGSYTGNYTAFLSYLVQLLADNGFAASASENKLTVTFHTEERTITYTNSSANNVNNIYIIDTDNECICVGYIYSSAFQTCMVGGYLLTGEWFSIPLQFNSVNAFPAQATMIDTSKGIYMTNLSSWMYANHTFKDLFVVLNTFVGAGSTLTDGTYDYFTPVGNVFMRIPKQ